MERYGLRHPDEFAALPVWFLNDEAQYMELEHEVQERKRRDAEAERQAAQHQL